MVSKLDTVVLKNLCENDGLCSGELIDQRPEHLELFVAELALETLSVPPGQPENVPVRRSLPGFLRLVRVVRLANEVFNRGAKMIRYLFQNPDIWYIPCCFPVLQSVFAYP